MRRYSLIVLGLIAVVAALGLPPRYSRDSWGERNRDRTPERARFLDLRDEMVRATWVHQRIQWRDSVSSVLKALPPNRPYLVQAPPGTPGRLLARVDSGISYQLRVLEANPPEVPVGIFLIPRRVDLHPSASESWLGGWWTQRETYVARAGEKPFCALVEALAGERAEELENTIQRLVFIPRDPRVRPNTLRICGFYAGYGKPGARIEAWLRRGAADFASGVNLEGRRFLLSNWGGRGPFGLFQRLSGISPRGMACLAGDEAKCEDAFLRSAPAGGGRARDGWLRGSPVEGSPVDFIEYRYRVTGPDFGFLDEHLLAGLEEEFGRERFRRFWRSDDPVPGAFLAAFGVSAGAWTRSWTQRHLGRMERGPTVPLPASVISLATVGLFAAAAGFMGRRRT